LSSDVRSSYPSRTSEKSELEAVGLGSGMACVPGVVAARDASLAGALPGRIPVSNIFCKGSEEDSSCPSKTLKQRNKETKKIIGLGTGLTGQLAARREKRERTRRG
jgi:hypothetical protein